MLNCTTKTKAPALKTDCSVLNRIPLWERAEHVDRLAEAYEVVHSLGGKVFTLRLGLDVLIAVTGSSDPLRTMSRRIQRAFQRAQLPVPLFAFCAEVTLDEKNELHLHGAIACDGISLTMVKNVLRSAGGRIEGRAGSRQVQLKNFDLENGGPAGWARYPRKGVSRTKKVIHQARVSYVSLDLQRLAKDRWKRRRAQCNSMPRRNRLQSTTGLEHLASMVI